MRMGLIQTLKQIGGIKVDNIEEAKTAGANIFVVGTAIIESKNIEGTIESLRK